MGGDADDAALVADGRTTAEERTDAVAKAKKDRRDDDDAADWWRLVDVCRGEATAMADA